VEENMRALRERRILWVVSVLIAVACVSVPARAKYGGGSGTADDPYQIWTAEQMNALGAEPNDWDEHFQLMADLDLSAFDGQEGRPAFNIIAPDADPVKWGFQGVPFSGVFDGNEHRIAHFTCKVRKRNYIGIFGYVSGPGAEIRNLGVTDPSVDAGDGSGIAGLVAWNAGRVFRCFCWGVVASYGAQVGGLVGVNEGTVIECYAGGDVSGDGAVGGLLGANKGVVTQCHYSGNVSGSSSVGGLAGMNDTAGIITGCYSAGPVSAREISGGGLIGENSGDVADCCSSADVEGGGSIGGLVGWNEEAIITRCYSTGTVHGTWDSIGGLVGYNSGCISYCYSTGAVHGVRGYTGGLAGFIFFGSGTPGEGVSHCFWDLEASGQTTSDGGSGRSTAHMKDIRTYLDDGWDFVGESCNGTCEWWQMPQAGGCPVQTALSGYTPPRLNGSGTAEDPYLIADAQELGAIVHYSRDARCRLTASIDLAGIRWGMAVIPRFAGTFDGNGMTIAHLTVTGDRYVGLFGRLEPGTQVRNLTIVDANVSGSDDYVGALAGDSAGMLTGCRCAGVVGNDGRYVGGLAGSSTGTVMDCRNDSAVAGYQEVGGLLGSNSAGQVVRCGNAGAVSWRKGEDPQWAVGGLVGTNGAGIVTQCYNTGAVTGGSRFTAGLIGINSGQVTDSYNVGAVDGTGQYVGGLAALNFGVLTDCYSAGAVRGTGPYVGGLVGCGSAEGRSREGPPPAYGGEVNDCFWDIQVSDQSTSAGGIGKSTAEMQAAGTFLSTGWDFAGETDNGTEDIWLIKEGLDYPHLWWEAAGE
jgi:hypothetical protein